MTKINQCHINYGMSGPITIDEFLAETAASSPQQKRWYKGHESEVDPDDFANFCHGVVWAVRSAEKLLRDKHHTSMDARFMSAKPSDAKFGVKFLVKENSILTVIDRDLFERSEWRAYCRPEFGQMNDVTDKKTGHPTNFRESAKLFILRALLEQMVEKEVITEDEGRYAFEDGRYEILEITSANCLTDFFHQTRHGNRKQHLWLQEYGGLYSPRMFADYCFDLYWGFKYALHNTDLSDDDVPVRVTLGTGYMEFLKGSDQPFTIRDNPEGFEIIINPFCQFRFPEPYSSTEPRKVVIDLRDGTQTDETTLRGHVKIDTVITMAQQLYDMDMLSTDEIYDLRADLVEMANLATKLGRAPYAN